ncbi:MAG: hypothetical protein AAF740_12675 [Bacteroidota bacterium]
MKNTGFTILLLLTYHCCPAQGGWDISYIPIDSINQSIIGKDVKLDFRGESDESEVIPKFLMGFISKEDSVKLSIKGRECVFREKREIYDDQGFYDEQYLECLNFNSNQEVVRVYYSVIEAQNNDAILVRLYLEFHSISVLKEPPDRRYCVSEWIPRRKLNGVMVKKSKPYEINEK